MNLSSNADKKILLQPLRLNIVLIIFSVLTSATLGYDHVYCGRRRVIFQGSDDPGQRRDSKTGISDRRSKTVSDETQSQIQRLITAFVSYDAHCASCLKRFKTIQDNTQCIFAKRARLWGSPEWNASQSVEENVRKILPTFIKFTLSSEELQLDGFVFELPAKFGDSVEVCQMSPF